MAWLELLAGLSEQLEETIALRRWGEGGDVADAVLFFASDAARYVTGEVLAVDGGLVRVASAGRSAIRVPGFGADAWDRSEFLVTRLDLGP